MQLRTLGCLCSAYIGLLSFACAAPSNDDFESRQMLAGTMVASSADNSAATTQPGEPPEAASKSLWWSWTAPAGGLVSLRVSPVFPMQGAVWQGDHLTSLNLVTATALPYTPDFTTTLYQFEAREGETYQISIGSVYPTFDDLFQFTLDLCSMRAAEPANNASVTGPTNLAVRLTAPRLEVEGTIDHLVIRALTPMTKAYNGAALSDFDLHPAPPEPLSGVFSNLPPNDYFIYATASNGAGRFITTFTNLVHVRPPNDDFASATEILNLPFSESYRLVSATDEAAEPLLSVWSLPGSVWWRWTAPKAEVVVAQADGLVGAFSGGHLNMLVPVGFSPFGFYNKNVLRLPVEAGRTYYFKVNPWLWQPGWKEGMQGTFILSEALPNDDFVNRIKLAGEDVTITVPSVLPSVEPDEPLPSVFGPYPGSLWWTWTAPTHGLFVLELVESGFAPHLLQEVFSGETLSTLSLRDFSDSLAVGPYLYVRAGEILQLALNAGATGTNAVFRLRFLPGPPTGGISRPVRCWNGAGWFFQASAEPGASLTIETSSDLLSWTDYLTFTPDVVDPVIIGPFPFDGPAQFFRTRLE
jgi:hypothetical protein